MTTTMNPAVCTSCSLTRSASNPAAGVAAGPLTSYSHNAGGEWPLTVVLHDACADWARECGVTLVAL